MSRREIEEEGYGPRALYELIDSQEVVRGARGLYRLADVIPFGNSAYALACRIVPDGVIALTSALIYHQLTTQIVSVIFVGARRFVRTATSEITIRTIVMPARRFRTDIERIRTQESERFRVFSRERTVCDCFAYPQLVPEDVAYEGLRRYLDRGERDLKHLEQAALETKTDAKIFPVIKTWQAG